MSTCWCEQGLPVGVIMSELCRPVGMIMSELCRPVGMIMSELCRPVGVSGRTLSTCWCD